jgi:hypothetical protein
MWIRNRTTTHQLGGVTPFEVFHRVRLDVAHIHLWGSCVWVRDLTVGKLDVRGWEGRFIGYDTNSEGCHIYWPKSQTIGVERDLIFEDCPTGNKLVSLPESFPTKDKSPTPAVQPVIPTPNTNPNSGEGGFQLDVGLIREISSSIENSAPTCLWSLTSTPFTDPTPPNFKLVLRSRAPPINTKLCVCFP